MRQEILEAVRRALRLMEEGKDAIAAGALYGILKDAEEEQD